MTVPRLIPFLLLFMVFQCLSSWVQSDSGPGGKTYVEEYHYEAVPIGNENDVEQIVATLSFSDNGVILASTKILQNAEERIVLNMTREGLLISGTKNRTDRSGGLTESRIWRDEHKVYVEQTSGEHTRTTALEIPEGATLAIEGSLMVLLRSFPFGTTTQWHLFIIDFAGRSITATAEQAGIERVSVPAGTFTCYRVEILFHVLFLHPKVVCWLSRHKPHVLVKSVGKRRLFSPTYITTLVGQQLPESPTPKRDGEASR